MPIYEYQCGSCGRNHEIMQKYTDLPLVECPACGGPLRKLISSTSFVLKGGGWYKSGYTSGGSKTSEAKEGNGGKPEATAEGKTDSKSENKSETRVDKKLETASKTE